LRGASEIKLLVVGRHKRGRKRGRVVSAVRRWFYSAWKGLRKETKNNWSLHKEGAGPTGEQGYGRPGEMNLVPVGAA